VWQAGPVQGRVVTEPQGFAASTLQLTRAWAPIACEIRNACETLLQFSTVLNGALHSRHHGSTRTLRTPLLSQESGCQEKNGSREPPVCCAYGDPGTVVPSDRIADVQIHARSVPRKGPAGAQRWLGVKGHPHRVWRVWRGELTRKRRRVRHADVRGRTGFEK
jgi:hypothetical protein